MGGREGEGREGDWECNGCRNRNYAFRSFCNKCKQPRLLVDTKTPSDSKWLPRIGDWICTGCTNNNYASRNKCKKCGQPKEVTAMPVSIPRPTYSNYFARTQILPEQNFNISSNWPLVRDGSFHASGYGVQQALPWHHLGGVHHSSGVSYTSKTNQPYTNTHEWRNGDWICTCGFHNYSSREQCKKCNVCAPSSLANSAFPALGTKRLASEELIHHWDNKRVNAGHQLYPVAESAGVMGVNLPSSIYPTFSSGVVPVPSNPTILGKGAKQWRSGDWMCTNCDNHNYACRSHCNRCKTEREVVSQSVSVV